MKKINFMLLVFSLVLIIEPVVAQQDFSMVTSNGLNSSFENDYLFVFSEHSEVESNLHTAKVNDVKVLELDYDSKVQEDFGAYLNPFSNSVKVKVEKRITYKKIQLTNTDTGKVVVSKKMETDQNIIDLTLLSSGNYIMILTDDKNHIYSEKFSIY